MGMTIEPARLLSSSEVVLTSVASSLHASMLKDQLSRAGFPTCCHRVCSVTSSLQLQRASWTRKKRDARKQEAKSLVSSTKGLGDWTIDFLIQLNNLQLYNRSGLHGLNNYLELIRKSFHFIYFF